MEQDVITQNESINTKESNSQENDSLLKITNKLESKYNFSSDQLASVKEALQESMSQSVWKSKNAILLLNTLGDVFEGVENTQEELHLAFSMIAIILKNSKQQIKFEQNPTPETEYYLGIMKGHPVYKEGLLEIQKKREKEHQTTNNIDDTNNIKLLQQENFRKSLSLVKQAKSEKNFPRDFDMKSFSLQSVLEGKTMTFDYNYLKDFFGEELTKDGQLEDFLRYQLYLHNKSEQAKSDPAITLSEEEQNSAKGFESFLSSSGIEANDFFASLPQDTSNIPEDQEIEPSAKSPSSLASLGDYCNSFPGLNETTQNLDNAFEGPEWADEKLMKILPLPARFERLRKDSPENTTNLYTDFVGSLDSPARIDYPLFASTEDPGQQRSDRHLFFISKLIELNLIQDQNDLKNLALPTMNGFPTDLTEIQKLAQERFSLLVKEQLNLTDSRIKQESGEKYMRLLSEMMALPELSKFQVNPEEVIVEADGWKIPYRLPGHQEVSGYIKMNKEGDIFMTNMLYDEGNTNSKIIQRGEVYVGSAPSLKQYCQAIGKKITKGKFKEMLASPQPTETINESIGTLCEQHSRKIKKKFDLTQAGLTHQLSGSLAQDAFFKELEFCGLGEDLKGYNSEAQGGSSKTFDAINNPEIAKTLFPIRNSTLSFSAIENRKFANLIQQMGELLRDPKLDEKLRNLNPDDLNGGNAILYHCFPADQRKSKDWMPILISLLCHPAPLDRQTLSLPRFDKFIQQLKGLKNDSVTPTSFKIPHDLHNPDFQKIIESKENPDKELDIKLGEEE